MDCIVRGVAMSRTRLNDFHFSFLQGNYPNPGIKPVSPALAGGCFTIELPGKSEFSP